MTLKFKAMETVTVRAYQRGGKDAYGNAPIKTVSDGGAIPCRHCLKPVAKGEPYLILAHQPFEKNQPYAETGPIFLHAEECERAPDAAGPAKMHQMPERDYILRGYDENNWIKYDEAEIVPAIELAEAAERMLRRDDVAYLHMRSALFNCYQCRIERS